MNQVQENEREADEMPPWREVFLYFLFLGFVNIGGPVAQITMMFNHMVEKRRWLSKDRFVKIMAFCHMLPGPEALQLAIYVGYLKRKLWGGIVAGLTFILPGAVVMIVLSWLYVEYGRLPQVTNTLYVLKPAVLGIIADSLNIGRVESDCRSRLATFEKSCADVAGRDWWNWSRHSIRRLQVVPNRMAVSQDRAAQFWWRICVIGFRAARRSRAISLVV
jgi:chromate transport protein ChrA